MADKSNSAWAKLQRKSASLRRGLEQLLREAAQLAESDKTDSISGYNVASSEVAEWQKLLAQSAPVAEKITEGLRGRASSELEGFEDRLIRALRDAGHSVYGETALFVINGIVHAEIDTKAATARINGKTASEISVNAIRQAVLDELDHVRKAITPPEKFIALLLRAYEIERAQTSKEFGSQIQTSALLWQLAMLKQQPVFRSNPTVTSFREYPKEVFRADLYMLLESNLTDSNGKRFRYASGSDTAGAMFMLVPQLGRTAHIGRIWFEHGD
jgi:hypothetical protein